MSPGLPICSPSCSPRSADAAGPSQLQILYWQSLHSLTITAHTHSSMVILMGPVRVETAQRALHKHYQQDNATLPCQSSVQGMPTGPARQCSTSISEHHESTAIRANKLLYLYFCPCRVQCLILWWLSTMLVLLVAVCTVQMAPKHRLQYALYKKYVWRRSFVSLSYGANGGEFYSNISTGNIK